MGGPERDVQALAAMLNARLLHGLYAAPCAERLPSIAFSVGGRSFTLSHEDYVLMQEDSLCLLGLQSMKVPFWILGDVFMRKFYVQFDWGRQRLGFALARSGREDGGNLV